MIKIIDQYIAEQTETLFKNQKQEALIILKTGLTIVRNNLSISGYNEFVISEIEKKFRKLFNIHLEIEKEISINKIIDPSKNDILGKIYEEHIHINGTRKSTGQFYSPKEVVDYMVNSLKLDKDSQLLDRNFIDIACGTGIFLISAAKKIISILKKRNVSKQDIIEYVSDHIFGFDMNPVSCMISKINLFILLLNELGPESIIKHGNLKFSIYETNSIENRFVITDLKQPEAFEIKNRRGKYIDGFCYILGNPPYLEAKKMPTYLKDICKSNYPDTIFGAFDLYIAFLSQCNRLVSDHGTICLILPNKFLVSKYGVKMRDLILKKFRILELVDLSEMDIFHRADVYPIVLRYKNDLPKSDHKVLTKMSIQNFEELISSKKSVLIPQEFYRSIGHMLTYFCLPPKEKFADTFLNIFERGKPISEYIEFRSTVSFHQKGLREQFVKKSFTEGEVDPSLLKKYLGGISYSRSNEVKPFQIDWNGYYINYDQKRLKEMGNPLPPLSNFECEKIIFCQHAKQITATYDPNGEWVTKDVYPIAFGKPNLSRTSVSLKYSSGLLNSKLFSFIYGIIYKGIQISAGYYHYLPSWMEILPVVEPNRKAILLIEDLVDKTINCEDHTLRSEVMDQIDSIVYRIYGINQQQQAIIRGFLKKPKIK